MTVFFPVLLLLLGDTSGFVPPGEVGGDCLQGREPCFQPNSQCIEGTCLCANFYRFHNGSCITEDQSASLGKPCRGGGDCRGPGEFCSSFSVCMCLSTHVDVGSQCRPAVYPGQFGCEDARQCSKGFPGAECDSSRRCVCPHGMQAQQQTCVLPLSSSNVILSDDRFSSIRRAPSNFFSRQRHRQQSSALSGAIAPDSVCSTDSDCAGYPLAFCDGVCRCVSGALNAGSTCISSGNALQPAGSCAAGQTYVTEAGACMTVQQPGEPCQYSQQCAASEPGAFCLRLRCECVYGMKQSGAGCTFVDNQCTKRGYIWISELGECKEVLPPGGRGCSHNLQCTHSYPEASCFLQTCTCPINFPVPIDGTCGRNCSTGETYSGVTGQCLPTVKPGNQCLYSSQCHAINPGMICDRNRCRCPSGMVFSGTKCTQQCPVGFIVNSRGVCSPGCRSNQVEFEGECLDQAMPGAPCVVNAQCMGGASCHSGACLCPKGLAPRGSICVFLESAPGAACGDGQQCMGGSYCSNGNCTCPAGRQIVNGVCVTPLTVPPNSPCNPSSICGGGSFCLGSICTCPVSQTPVDGKCQGPVAVPPGGPCLTGNERCMGQSSCVGGVCQCPFGTIPNKNECVAIQASQAGAPCDANTRCTGLAVCIDGTCQCQDGLVASGGNCRAATQVAPGSSCAMGEVCVGGSSCVSNICVCPRSTKLSNGVCLPFASADPGSSCSNGEMCLGGSNCQNGVCVCPSGFVSFQGVCQSTAGSLGQCDAGFKCPGGAYCDRTRNQCACPAHTILVGSLCISTARFVPSTSESACSYDADCEKGRVCVQNKCRCMFGELPEGTCRNLWAKRLSTVSKGHPEVSRPCPRDNNVVQKKEELPPTSTPKPIVDIGSACVRVGVACGGGSICIAGICVCPLGQIPWQNKCVEHRTAKPGETCSRGEECTGGTACDESTMKCECIRPSQMVIGSTCQERLRSHPGYPCSNGEMCVGGSSCRDGRCACSDGKIEVNKHCVDRTTVGAGDVCGNGEICGGNSECDYLQKKCTCKRGQQVINSQCVEVLVVPPGDICSGAVVRCGGGAYCVRGRCECPANQVPLAGKCVAQKQVPPGKTCTEAEICMGRSVCRDGVCRCTSDMVLVGTSCEIRRKIRPSETCRMTDECLGGSKCNGHICECPPGQVVMNSTCQPRQKKRPGLSCRQEDICVGQSICVQGKCQCRPGEKPVNGVCTTTPQVIPGGPCSANDDCIGGSSCTGGVCMCPPGQAIVAHVCKQIVKAMPGNTCANGEICDGSSYCHVPSKTCRCQPGYMVAQGRCLPLNKNLPILVPQLSRSGVSTPRPYNQPSFCRSNLDCIRGAVCRGGICACPLHLIMKNGACMSTAISEVKRRPGLLKEPCETDVHCSVPNSFCTSDGVCDCRKGFRIFGSTQCIRIHSVVMRTTTTTTTTTSTPRNIEIPTTTIPEHITRSIYERQPGEDCDDMSLCTQNSACVNGRCRCGAGFTQVYNSCILKRNIIVAPLSSCVGGEVCGGGSHCFYGFCFCIEEETLFRGECKTLEQIDEIRKKEVKSMTTKTSTRFQRILSTLPATTPSTTTTTTTQTTTTTTTPKTTSMTRKPTTTVKARPLIEVIPPGSIATTPGTTRKPVFWFKVARPGFECDDSTFCTNCSVCVDGFCSCPDGLELIGEKCLSPIDARSCLASNQCPSGAECVGGECRCSPGLALSRFGFCMPLTYVDPGMSCKEGETCRGGSECREGMCVCPEGLFVRDNKCLPAVSDATRRKRAIQGTDDNTFLKLITQAEKLSTNLKQSLPLGERCSSQNACSSGSVCMNGVCQCPESEVQAGTTCLQRNTIGADIAQPGQDCQSGIFCDGGASCVSFVCRCPSGYETISGVCSPVLAKASDDCSGGQRCSAGSLCVQGKCICPKGFANVEGSCVAIGNVAKSPGLSCVLNPQICTGGSFCQNGICTCPTGTENVGGVCAPSSGITSYSPPGGPCVANQVICTGNSVCANGFCVCPGGERIRNGVCVSVDSQADPGQICQEGITVCTGNSLCTSGLCSCPSGQTSLNGQCVRVVTASPSCVPPCGFNAQCLATGCQCNTGFSLSNGQCLPQCNNQQCQPNSFCQQGVCQCNQGYSYTNGLCSPSFSSCSTQCSPNGVCNNGICNCNPGYVYYQDQCAPQCFSNSQCTPNSSCQQGACVCNTGYTYSQGQCYPQCSATFQCLPNSSCQQGLCTCNTGYSYTNGQCSPQCLSNAQCFPNSNCQQGTCTCNTGYSFSNGQCLASAGQCFNNAQCSPNSFCQQGTCTCNSGYVFNNGQCSPQCSSNAQCYPNSSCQQGLCTCNNGYAYSNGQCNQQCFSNNQCNPNSSCQQGICACNAGYSYSNGQCLASPGECLSNAQCSPNSSCQQGTCACNTGYVFAQGQCYPQCQSNAQCSPNSFCQQGACNCNTGFSYSNGQCLLLAPSGPCFSNAQCSPNSSCQQGTCTCNTGYVFTQGQCYPQCQSTNQCIPNSSCQQGVCSCNTGYSYSNGLCNPQCSSNLQCTPNSSCQQGICSCNTGFSYLQGQCYPSCSTNTQCSPNSSCQQGLCSCNSGYVYSQGQCSPQCSTECQPNASCQQGSCQCNAGYLQGGSFCQPSFNPALPINPFFGLPGQPCDLRPGALLCRNRAICVNNQCVCPTNLILAGRECVEFAGDAYPGQFCSPASICRGGATCAQGRCLCDSGYYQSGPQCVPTFQFRFTFSTPSPNPFELPPGSSCNPVCEFQPCLQSCGGGSRCVNGFCQCPVSTYPFNGVCVPQAVEPLPTTAPPPGVVGPAVRTARPGDYCDFSITCTGGSSCILGSCTCDPNYTPSFDRSSCVLTGVPLSQRSYPGGRCVKDRDCQGNSFCAPTGICSCLDDEEVNEKSCKKRSPVEVAFPGSPCPATKICNGNSLCQAGYCICPAQTAANSTGSCTSVLTTDTSAALPGSRCRLGGPPCEGGSWCVDGYCICRGGSKNLGDGKCSGGTTDISGSGFASGSGSGSGSGKKRCTSFRECDEPRVCATSGVCECPFTMSETSTGICIYRNNEVPPGSYCDGTTAKCSAPSSCENHRCVCPPGYSELSGSCRRSSLTVFPGAACLPGDFCIPGASCVLGVCQCENGATPDNRACRLINKRDLKLRPPSDEWLRPCPSDGSCKLPNCFCSQTGTVPPGGLQTRDVPQMVILTFDDPVTDRTINIYKSMFSGKFRNPNGCPIKGTFFISHQFNNYDQSQWLHSRGNEIALNSITHEKLNNATKDRWRHEMVGLRDSLKAFSYAEPSTIKGVRAPHLLTGGDNQFDMMAENDLLYDNSMTAQEGPLWPQTLDYQLAWDCGEQNCPKRPHKGIWLLPMQLISSNDGIWHSVARTAVKPYDNRETSLRLLQRNFYRNYNGHRAPFILNADSDFLTYLPDNGVVHAVEDWLKEILNKTDVYVVTATQAIEWMKRPTAADSISSFKPWQCNQDYRMHDHVHPCETPSICSYDSRGPTGMPHSFRVCGSCPPSYPWILDSLGRKQLNI